MPDHVIAYSSCKNRHCPECEGPAARDWMAASPDNINAIALCTSSWVKLRGRPLPWATTPTNGARVIQQLSVIVMLPK
ncbi:MAG: transposase zinc-binding domain-containing protein [Celeribacter marinus]